MGFLPAGLLPVIQSIVFFICGLLLMGFLPGGFLRFERAFGRTWGLHVFGAAHEFNQTTQVPPLWPVIRSRPAQPLPPEILRPAGLSAGQQGRQPAAVAGLAQGPRLLPGLGQPPAGAGLASGASGLLAAPTPEVARVTRSLPGASPCSSRK